MSLNISCATTWISWYPPLTIAKSNSESLRLCKALLCVCVCGASVTIHYPISLQRTIFCVLFLEFYRSRFKVNEGRAIDLGGPMQSHLESTHLQLQQWIHVLAASHLWPGKHKTWHFEKHSRERGWITASFCSYWQVCWAFSPKTCLRTWTFSLRI